MHHGLLKIFERQLETAAELFGRAQRICEKNGELLVHSYVLFGKALIEHEANRPDLAWNYLRRCVELKTQLDDVVGSALLLDLIGWVRASEGDGDRAGVALGAAERLWSDIGMDLYGSKPWLQRRERSRDLARTAVGDRAFDTGHGRGAAMSVPDAFAVVLNVAGNQPAPTSGAVAGADPAGPRLTRREAQIAQFVARGLTNRRIGQELTLSTRTVEGHVQQLLAKLGFTSRAQIAVWMSTQPSRSDAAESRVVDRSGQDT